MSQRQAEPAASVFLPVLPGERVIARLGATEVLLVTSSSSAAEQALAEQTARRALSDTPFHTPAYAVADPEPEIQVYLARAEGQARALAVLRPRRRWAWWSWDDWDEERRPATGVAPMTSWTVETIWTLAQAQQRGAAQRLLEEASRVVDQPIASFGWRRPFTPSGEEFVRRLCPEGFWVPD